jgi:hypothetical protein
LSPDKAVPKRGRAFERRIGKENAELMEKPNNTKKAVYYILP